MAGSVEGCLGWSGGGFGGRRGGDRGGRGDRLRERWGGKAVRTRGGETEGEGREDPPRGRSCYARVRVGDRQPQIAGGEGAGGRKGTNRRRRRGSGLLAQTPMSRERSAPARARGLPSGKVERSSQHSDGRPARESSPIRQRTPTHAGVAAGHPPAVSSCLSRARARTDQRSGSARTRSRDVARCGRAHVARLREVAARAPRRLLERRGRPVDRDRGVPSLPRPQGGEPRGAGERGEAREDRRGQGGARRRASPAAERPLREGAHPEGDPRQPGSADPPSQTRRSACISSTSSGAKPRRNTQGLDEHELMLKRLSHELTERKALCERERALEVQRCPAARQSPRPRARAPRQNLIGAFVPAPATDPHLPPSLPHPRRRA